MKRNLLIASLFALTVLSTACEKADSSRKVASVDLANPSALDVHQDQFIFRDADTNEVLPEEALPGRMMSTKFSYLAGSARGWAGGVLKWSYNPTGQPANLNTQEVIDGLIASTRRWEKVCGITFQYQGTTSNAVNISGCNRLTVVGWTSLPGNVIGQTQACFSGSNFTEMDLALDNTQISNVGLMQTVATHEFGHAFGLGHTDISPAVMTAYLTTGFPVQDDMDGCQSLYGVPMTTSPLPTPTPTPIPKPPVPAPTPTPTMTPPAPPTAMVCQPNSTRSCNSFTGSGVRTCRADGQAWSACRINQCKSGYRLVNGQCRRVR
jgi:hypothetical protein